MMGVTGFSALGMMLGWLSMVASWLLVLMAIVLLFKGLTKQSSCSGDHSQALEVLKERYAKGEVDKKQFTQMKKDLSE